MGRFSDPRFPSTTFPEGFDVTSLL